MKKTKFIPAALLVASALASCGGGGSNTPTNLTEFVNNLKDGDVAKEEVDKLFSTENLLETGDDNVTFATFKTISYMPAWALQEAYQEEYTEDLTETVTFKKYDNNVIVTDSNYIRYGYDASVPSTCISKTPVEYKDKAYITKEEDDKIRYTYLYDNNKEDDLSFNYLGENTELSKNWFVNGGGMSSYLRLAYSDYDANKESYIEYESEGYKWTDDYTATKADGKLKVSSVGRLHMPLYSAERVWGYDDYEAEEPTQRDPTYADAFAGCYVDRSLKFVYEFTVDGGAITDVSWYDYSYSTIVYKDKNWTEGQALPPYDLSEEYIAGLDLYWPETITFDGEEIANPYDGVGYDEGSLPRVVYLFSTSKESLGNYDTSKLPDTTGMRTTLRSTDHGNWFDVQDLVE